MRILITGATGLVGKKIANLLFKQGNIQLRILTRNKEKAKESFGIPIEAYEWNPDKNYIEVGALEGVNCIIHLAGESVADGRWTEKKKQKILDSRILSTKLLVNALKSNKNDCVKFISASAIGYYGDRKDLDLNENSSAGQGFLSEVCQRWEHEVEKAETNSLKVHIIRIGIVLAREGGALSKMLPAFNSGLGGQLGDGQQNMSWIHIDDLVGQFIFIVNNKIESTHFNGTSPNPVTNSVFSRILAKTIHRPNFFTVPAFALELALGEKSAIVLQSQKALPENFLKHNYKYKFESLDETLSDLLKYKVMGEEIITRVLWLNKSPAETFSFFSDETNLEKITPENLNFKIVRKSTEKIKPGTLIDYKLKLHGIPLKWKTLIKNYEPDKNFVDEQLKGPYSKWHHSHTFEAINSGTLMTDEVVYKVPFGAPGRLLAGSYVNKDVVKIFSHRNRVIKSIFQQKDVK